MEKYKYRSTVYLVFMLVSLFINGVLLYMLIFESANYNATELEQKAQNIYESAYNIINKDKNNFYTLSSYSNSKYPGNTCYLVDFTGLDQFFTTKVLNYLKSDLIISNNLYYDCNNVLSSKLADSLFSTAAKKAQDLNFVSYNNDTLVVKENNNAEDSTYHYLILKYENNKMLIDSFE